MSVESALLLREYALLADGWRGALVGSHGEVAFLCVPRWDGGAVFPGLLGGPRTYALAPHGPLRTWGGSYEPVAATSR